MSRTSQNENGSGDLPLDICAEDDKRVAENIEEIDPDPQERAAEIFNYMKTAERHYTMRWQLGE